MKVLLVGLKVGAGLESICQAVGSELEKFDNIETAYVDIYRDNRKRKNFQSKNYYKLVKFCPHLVAWAQKYAYRRALKAYDNHTYLNADVKASKEEICKLIEEYKPDLIFTPLNFLAIALDELIDEGRNDIKYMFMLPDFIVSYYTQNLKHCLRFFSSCEQTTKLLIEKGFDKDKIVTAGIPIRDIFQNENMDAEEIKKSLNTNKEKFILVSNGGAGFGSNYQIVRRYHDKVDGYTFIVVNGRNEKSKKQIDKFISKNNIKNVINLGFASNMHELIYISDIMIGKCGSSTLCEAAKMGVKYIAIDNNLFPELMNIAYLQEQNAIRVAKNTTQIGKILSDYIFNPENTEKIKQNFAKISSSNSANIIAETINNYLK